VSEEESSLDQSVSKLGRLVPIIKDAHGNIIDGFHRKQLDPKWEEEFAIKLDNIKDPTQLLLARMNINVCRRAVSTEEKTKWLTDLAQMTGWTPKEIAEKSGWSERTVYRYMPKELKAPEPEQLATAKVSQEIIDSAKVALEKIPETPKEAQIEEKPLDVAVPCSAPGCSLNTKFPKHWEGKPVCSVCFDKLSRGEITLEKPDVSKPSEAPTPPPRVEKRVYEPPKDWREEMHKPVSRMDEWLYEELQRRGVPVKFQEPVCIKFVVPEVEIAKGDKPLVVFLDHPETHAKRTLADIENRELLVKRGKRVLELQYDAYTEEQRQLIIKEVMDAVTG
jgi:hypothetical protein